MTGWNRISRRRFIQGSTAVTAAAAAPQWLHAVSAQGPLDEFGYGDVTLAPGLTETQFEETHSLLMGLSDDELLKPFRVMSGKPAPGRDLGGWYGFDAHYNNRDIDSGFAPAHCYGQWLSALARGYAISGSKETRDKVLRLNQELEGSVTEDFFKTTRFPAYTYDKLVLGLIDSQKYCADPNAFSVLDKVTDIATPEMPAKGIERYVQWRPGTDETYSWDESYTMPENLFLAHKYGAGQRYRDMAPRYLLDQTFFNPLSRNEAVLKGRHAYSTVNMMCSGMQAYLSTGDEKYLLAGKNAYAMLMAQSFATGGWGPDEQLSAPNSDALYESLTKTHSSFETPCGAYAHFKLTRYLLRITRDSRYGDSMERIMYNTVLGAKPMHDNGNAFYYADYNSEGKRSYSNHIWPCCGGTLPQIAADYRISSYLHDGRDVYVNLYLPSTLRWKVDGKDVSLTQQTEYPLEDTIRMKLALSHQPTFAISLRIPAWAEGASVTINGQPSAVKATPGSFVRLERKWKNGDQIALTLPPNPRLEAIHARHADTVALLSGPLVLFALAEGQPQFSRKQLLAARRVEGSQWVVEGGAGTVKFAPFTALGDSPYKTYLQAT